MKGKWIFDSFAEWRGYLRRACWGLAKGLMRLVYAIVIGLVSLIVFCGKQVEAFCKRETVAAIIIGVVIVSMAAGWILTFTSERFKCKTAQYTVDSLSYSLSQFEQLYDSTATIVINGDTIRNGK